MAHFSFHQATSNKQQHKLTIAETITRDQYPYHYETGQYNENLKKSRARFELVRH